MSSHEEHILPDDAQLRLARAFDAAWEPFLTQEGAAADTDENRKRLAGKIVELAKSGVLDEDELGAAGLIHLRVLAETDRISARNRAEPASAPPPETDEIGGFVPNWENPAGQAFAPDTVAAMSTALNLCLDQLPLRLPSGALQFLSANILAQASRGERDPEKMHEAALEALRTR